MVVDGLAVTVAPVVVLKPVAGDHEYVEAPLAVNATEPPEQMAGADGVMLTVGSGFTVTATVAVLVQPVVAVPVTV